MRYKRVLLVQAMYDNTFSNVLPYGLGVLSEVLTAGGIENDVYDLNRDKRVGGLLGKIRSFSPDLVGVSMMSLNYRHTFRVMAKIKRFFPGIKIAAGGPHISTVRQKALEDERALDYGAVLEGEDTLVELCRGAGYESIKGLMFRESGGRVTYTGDREFRKDLDSIPFPKYGKFDKSRYSGLITIITSRGCPYECIYCPVKLAIGRSLRFRSAGSVADEIERHYRLGFREFSFRDDNFTFREDHVYSVCDEIIRRGMKGLYLMCDNGVRADRVDEKMLIRMREAGFRMLGFGIESGSQKILDNIKKRTRVEDMKKAVAAACRLGYKVELFFLIGSPGETWDDFMESVKFATEFPISVASFYQLLPYPSTELFDYVSGHGRFLSGPEKYLNRGSQRRNTPFFETPEFTRGQRKKAFTFALEAVRKSPVLRAARVKAHESNLRAKLARAGIKGRLQDAITGVYCNEFLHDHIFNNPVTAGVKKMMMNRPGGGAA
ncbi:MAG: radical SAM protein [Candidatus Omnitrophota bacterium]